MQIEYFAGFGFFLGWCGYFGFWQVQLTGDFFDHQNVRAMAGAFIWALAGSGILSFFALPFVRGWF